MNAFVILSTTFTTRFSATHGFLALPQSKSPPNLAGIFSPERPSAAAEMEKKAVLVCSVVSFFILLVLATGFAAEATRVKDSQITIVGSTTSPSCIHPGSPAMVLGLTAALSLLLGQMMIYVSAGCICCLRGPRPSGSKWKTAMICFVFSWVLGVMAFIPLLVGAVLNSRRNVRLSYHFGGYNYECNFLRPGIFAAATIVAVASLVLGLVYFLILNSAKNPSIPPRANIAMGQPQFPPPPPQRTTDPVFGHEDAYAKRQFT